MGIIETIKQRFRTGGALWKLLIVNVAVFLVLRLLLLCGFVMGFDASRMITWIELPSQPEFLLVQPWSVLTFMVAHVDVWHIVFNMLWFYWMGKMFLDYFTSKQLTALYYLGGIMGGLFYILALNVLPRFSGLNVFMLGASASVMAIVVALTVYAPDRRIGLLFIGAVELKWVTLVMLVLDLLSITGDNYGGHISHLGGAAFGVWFALMMRRGRDITSWLNRVLDKAVSWFRGLNQKRAQSLGGGRKKPMWSRDNHNGATREQYTAQRGKPTHRGEPTEEEIDVVLDKLKKSGYAGLTEKDKDTLFRASRKR